MAPAATVSRVEQAESELKAAQEGHQRQDAVGAGLPAVQRCRRGLGDGLASAVLRRRLPHRRAAVAAEAAVRDYTTALQTSLRDAGYYNGEVDGVYGPATVDAVEALQEAHGLPSTGTVDKATADALQDDLAAKGGATAQQEVATTAAVQQTLKLAGFWDGPVDGMWTPALTEALKDFQTELGVEPTGTVDAATLAALEKAIEEAQAEPSASPTSEPSDPVVGHERDEPDGPVLDLTPASGSPTRSGIIRNGVRRLAALDG